MKSQHLIKFFYLMLLVVTFFSAADSLRAQENDIVLGKQKIIYSKILNEDRPLLIYLPPNYENSHDKYPVLYLLDGGAHFHYGTGITNFLARNAKASNMIVVGIPNTNRNRDFTPTHAEGREFGGGAENFQNFLEKELIPYMEKNYRTVPYRILFGHSLTGMFSVYTMLTRPELFSAYIAASPWFIYDENYLVKKAPELLEKNRDLDKFLYMTVGDEPEVLPAFHQMVEIFREKAPDQLDWHYAEMPNDDHGSLTLPTLHDGLGRLYRNWALPDEEAEDLPSVLSHYRNLSSEFGYKLQPSELTINILGYRALQNNRQEEAIRFFKYNVENNPESPNVYDSLGEGYEAQNEFELARQNYQMAYRKGKRVNDPNTAIFKEHLDNVNTRMGI
ncbi:MAG: alpha/beta hydrolase-fold protein [Calditrichia bacterium]